jgi:hypothetical protein
MKLRLCAICIAAAATAAAAADDPELAEKLAKHQKGSIKLSDEQDELAADVQQLTIEQTLPPVIELLREVEGAMADASERLYTHDTGGETIAAETEVIEKIYEAAEKRQQQSQGEGQEQSEAGGAMLEMMQRMMGKEPGQGQGQGQGNQPNDQGGQGVEGDSDAANQSLADGANEGRAEERTVPKGAGDAGKSLPREFNDALKGYNRGTERLSRQP